MMKNYYASVNEEVIVVPVTDPGDLNNPPGTGADEADFEEDEDEDDDDDVDTDDDPDDDDEEVDS
jgi:hypothetical protein